jgi:hypothetical protein
LTVFYFAEVEVTSVRGRSGEIAVTPMSVESEFSRSDTDSKLKPTRVINKRGKSRKRDVSSKRRKNVKF